MRCALDCLHILKEYYDFDYEGAYQELQTHITTKGISMYVLVDKVAPYGLGLIAKKGLFLPKQCPCILFYKPIHAGHFNVLVRNDLFFVVVWDTKYKERRIFKPWFYLFFSHIYILCYNVKKEVQNGS